MNVSQIYLSDSEDQELSPFLKYATSTVVRAFPGANHTIYDKQSLRKYIVDNYESDVVWAYDKLRPYAYKADLGRYCLLQKLGGWYFDISVRLETPAQLDERIEFLGFRDIQKHSLTSWACSTTILFSKPDNKVFGTAIAYVVRNCREEFYGRTPLCPTGPTVLGEALAAHRSQDNYVFGDVLELTPTHEIKNKAFILPDGIIMAWNKPAKGGDLTGLGANGVNNYNEFWHTRNVYDPKI
jgi:mannosyltransferase OCH1-like enzyme